MAIEVSNAPRSGITIGGIALQVAQPFAEGHTLRDNEAAVLNQTYSENIRNNFASKLTAHLETKAREAGLIGEKEDLTKEAREVIVGSIDVAEIQAMLDSYMTEYDFGVRRAGGEPRITDPVLKEALRIAAESVKAALAKKGTKLDAEEVKKLAAQAVERHPQFMERAREIVAARKSVGVEELDLGV